MATITARIDNDVKADFINFCDAIGITASSLFNMFAKTCIREQKIPFEIQTMNFDAKRVSKILDESNSFYQKLKSKPWGSEDDIMDEMTKDRRDKFAYGKKINTP